MPIIEGATATYVGVGAPVNGTDAIFTMTVSATAATFTFSYDGYTSSVVSWSATNTQLFANMQAALDAMPPIGAAGTVVAVGSMTAGIGTALVTFSGARLAKTAVATLTITTVTLTGAAAALSLAYSTSGVTATYRNAGRGSLYADGTASGKLYHNASTTVGAPTWTAQT